MCSTSGRRLAVGEVVGDEKRRACEVRAPIPLRSLFLRHPNLRLLASLVLQSPSDEVIPSSQFLDDLSSAFQ